MSDTRKASASISGPKKRQAYLDGELPESRKRCIVEMVEASTEPAGAVLVATAAPAGSKELIVRAIDPSILFVGDARQEDGSVISCEIGIGGESYAVTSITPDTIDEQSVLRLALSVLTAKGKRLEGMAAIVMAPFRPLLGSAVEEGQPLEVSWRRVETTYYGTFVCVPGGSAAYQRKRQQIEMTWRRENKHPLFVDGQPNPLPSYIREALDLEAEVGTSVVDFEDFVDDNGPIPNRLPNGKLNEDGLLALLQIRDFHAALTEFYAGDAFDVEQWIAMEKKVSKSSPGILSTPAASGDSLPS